MKDALMTSIVCKNNVTLVDIGSTRMLGQFGFLSQVGGWQPGSAVFRLCLCACDGPTACANMRQGSMHPAYLLDKPRCRQVKCCGALGVTTTSCHLLVVRPPARRQVFEIFSRNKISVDVVATSEVSVSLTLDPAK